MVLSKRERYIAIGVGAAAGLFVLDRVILQPLVDQRVQLSADVEKTQKQFNEATQLISKRRDNNIKWTSMLNSGMKGNATEAESQAQNSIIEWAKEAGVYIEALRQDKTVKEKEFTKTIFRANVTGNMAEIGRFIHRIQTSSIPIKITDLQMNPRKEATDDLVAVIGIGTIYFTPEPPKPAAN